MPTTDTNVPQVVVNKLTKAQYEAATKSPTEFYAVSDEQIGTSDIADGAVTAAKIDFTTINRQVKTGVIGANDSLTITNVTGKDAFIVAGRAVSNAYDLFFIDSVGGVVHIAGTNSFTCSSDSSNRTVTITSSLGVSSSIVGMFEA